MGNRRELQVRVLQIQKAHELFRLSELGFNERATARATGIARSSLREHLRPASIAGLNYEQARRDFYRVRGLEG